MKRLLFALALCLLPSLASAQAPLVNPKFLDFDCPAATGGLSDADGYLVDFYMVNGVNPFQSATPVPATAVTVITTTTPNTCRIDLRSIVYPAGIPILAKLRAALGALASGPSNATVPFGRQGAPLTPVNVRATP